MGITALTALATMRPIGTGMVECHNVRTATNMIAARTSPGAVAVICEMRFHVCMARKVGRGAIGGLIY
jgi:hypothetical protein